MNTLFKYNPEVSSLTGYATTVLNEHKSVLEQQGMHVFEIVKVKNRILLDSASAYLSELDSGKPQYSVCTVLTTFLTKISKDIGVDTSEESAELIEVTAKLIKRLDRSDLMLARQAGFAMNYFKDKNRFDSTPIIESCLTCITPELSEKLIFSFVRPCIDAKQLLDIKFERLPDNNKIPVLKGFLYAIDFMLVSDPIMSYTENELEAANRWFMAEALNLHNVYEFLPELLSASFKNAYKCIAAEVVYAIAYKEIGPHLEVLVHIGESLGVLTDDSYWRSSINGFDSNIENVDLPVI